MKKHVFGRKLKRDANERKALFRSLIAALITHERIETTEAKAKAVRGQVEKLVTRAKEGSVHARSLLQQYVTGEVLEKLMKDVAPRFAARNGGYTRIIKLDNRFSDNAKMVLLEWVEKSQKLASAKAPKEAKTKEKQPDVMEAEIVKEEPKKEKETKTGKTAKKESKPKKEKAK